MIRDWISRDDGKWFRVGNERLGVLQAIGYLAAVAGFLAGACRSVFPELPCSICWLLFLGGMLLALVGEYRSGDKPEAQQPAGADPAGSGPAQP